MRTRKLKKTTSLEKKLLSIQEKYAECLEELKVLRKENENLKVKLKKEKNVPTKNKELNKVKRWTKDGQGAKGRVHPTLSPSQKGRTAKSRKKGVVEEDVEISGSDGYLEDQEAFVIKTESDIEDHFEFNDFPEPGPEFNINLDTTVEKTKRTERQSIRKTKMTKRGERDNRKPKTKGKRAKVPSTDLSKTVVKFLDDLLNQEIQRKMEERFTFLPMDCYNAEGLGSFEHVLKKTMDSCMIKALRVGEKKKSAITAATRHTLEYFEPPMDTSEGTSNNLEQKSISDDGGTGDRTLKTRKIVTDSISCICDVCGKGASSQAVLKRHMITHSEKREPCPICGKLFKRKDDVPKHVRVVHEKNFRFTCSMCPKKFTNPSDWRRHERRHLGIKPHLCSECGRRFPESKNLRMHMESQHGATTKRYRVPIVI